MSLSPRSASAQLRASCGGMIVSQVYPVTVKHCLPPNCAACCHSRSFYQSRSRHTRCSSVWKFLSQAAGSDHVAALRLFTTDPFQGQCPVVYSHTSNSSYRMLSSSSRAASAAQTASSGIPSETTGPGGCSAAIAMTDGNYSSQECQPTTAGTRRLAQPQQQQLADQHPPVAEGANCSGHHTTSSPMDVFQKGVAISVWQNSSDVNSQWTEFMAREQYFGQKHLISAFMQSNDFWNKYEDDIQLVKALGCNSFRFSFEWSRIEPAPGQLDRTAIARYHQILDCLEAAGLLPNVTLHHFTHPQWFEALGGFTNEKNIPAFINYSTVVFQEFGHRIPFWSTFNEPSCFCLCGYIMGLWAPGQKGRLIKAGRILGNMLKAHVAVYRKLKAMPHGDTAQIGIVHQHIRFIPHCNWLASLIVRPVCHWMTYWFAARQMLDFFTTGKFTWRAPLIGQVLQFDDPAAVGALDFWGINYYSRPAISSTFKLVGTGPSEPLTGMGMPLVPGDLHRHLMQAHNELKVPVIVTETGVSDERHVLRARCISCYYNEILRAIADGCDVRGVYYWTLMDNIEWHHGFNQHFGLYAWRPSLTGDNGRPTDGSTLQLREGSKTLVELHNAWPGRLADMKALALQQFRAAAVGIGSLAGAAGNEGSEHVSVLGAVPGVQQGRVQGLEAEVVEADAKLQHRDVEEPLLGGGGRISDLQ